MLFVKSVKSSFFSCSLSVGQMISVKYGCNTLPLQKFSEALLTIVHVSLWVVFTFKCLVDSDVLFLSSGSFHLVFALRTVSPT